MLSQQLREDLQSIIEAKYILPVDKHLDPKSDQAAIIRRMKSRAQGGKQKLSSKRPPQPSKEVGGRVIPPGHKPRIRSDGKVMVHDPEGDRYY